MVDFSRSKAIDGKETRINLLSCRCVQMMKSERGMKEIDEFGKEKNWNNFFWPACFCYGFHVVVIL